MYKKLSRLKARRLPSVTREILGCPTSFPNANQSVPVPILRKPEEVIGDEAWRVHGVCVYIVSSLNHSDFDALVVLGTPDLVVPEELEEFLTSARRVDAALDQRVSVLTCPCVSGCRLVYAATGRLTPYDDVRSVYEVTLAGVRRAHEAGAVRPVLALLPHVAWPCVDMVTLLAALEAFYVPLQVRESYPGLAHNMEGLGVYGERLKLSLPDLVREAVAIEIARGVARDIGGADPERMTPCATASYLADVFHDSEVRIRIEADCENIKQEYPLMAAVARASDTVDRHRSCVIYLEYEPACYENTVMMVGKGVTYDTGGCDIKACGSMMGMSRDKCGAAAIAGFVKACDLLKPNVKVVASLGMTRNSVGEDAYVADELIKSRLGYAVRVGNTDAEGRMVMADLLAEMGERAQLEKCPHLYTVATLTGHVVRTYGEPYTAVVDNYIAARQCHARNLQKTGALVGDMLEVSRIRREDLKMHRPQMAGDQVHQASSQPTSSLPRGHHTPVAFMLLVSGVDRAELPYTHFDVAGSAGMLPTPPSAAPLLTLAAYYKLSQIYNC